MGIESGPSLSFGSGNWQEEMWVEVYDRAKKRKKIKSAQIGDWQFEYALINPKDGYGRNEKSSSGDFYQYGSNTTFWIKDAEKEGRIGLSEGGVAFVLEKEVPPEFQDLIGLHEFIEAKIGKGEHAKACLVELTELFKMEQDIIEKYAQWLCDKYKKAVDKKDIEKLRQGYFGRALPNFVEYLMQTNDTPVDILQKFKLQLQEHLQQSPEQKVIEQIKQEIDRIILKE